MYIYAIEVKAEHEASAKKRKTEWQAGLANLPGDVQLAKAFWIQECAFIF